jgi:hypothetical protein
MGDGMKDDFSEAAEAENTYSDDIKTTNMWAKDIVHFVNMCSMEWRIVESVHSPAGDVKELERRCKKLIDAFRSASKNAPNTRHPNNSFQRK